MKFSQDQTRLDRQLCAVLIAWHELEARLNSGHPVLDWQFAQLEDSEKLTFHKREDVELALLTLADSPLNDEAKKRRVIPALAYLNEVRVTENEKPEGSSVAYETYIEQTAGISDAFKPFSEEQLKEQQQRAEEALAHYGLTLETSHELLPQTGHLSDKQVENYLPSTQKRLVLRMADILGIKPEVVERMSVILKQIPSDRSFNAYIGSAENENVGDILVEFNTEHYEKQEDGTRVTSKGDMTRLIAHELAGHGVEGAAILHKVESGSSNPSSGLVGVWMPDMFQAEGLAETAHILLHDDIEDAGHIQAQAEVKHYQSMLKYSPVA
jgi:hypothetical protein